MAKLIHVNSVVSQFKETSPPPHSTTVLSFNVVLHIFKSKLKRMQRLGGFKIVFISCEGNTLVIDVALRPTNALQSADVQLSAPLGSPGTSGGRV